VKFYSYWVISVVLASLAAAEKFVSALQQKEPTYFWFLIAFAFFFWLSAYGAMVEARIEKDPPDDNPF
jgi:hypothetical protein